MTTDTSYATVWRAGDEGAQAVLDVLTEAFMNDPLVRWLFPAAGDRGRLQRHYYRPLLAHPAAEPHLYLPCIGVLGGWQGAGLGSAMLRHRLERADADGVPAYLEASSARSRALYLRHGFADLGEPVRVADGPLLWPMWRQPAQEGDNR
ncbi:GNAT family N-acetyltransferase [Microbispora siamensis]|uniref:N-acetyltransferase domain-containing protein n=1 Tax=Microbispora siamensis TaxID=564413 RepID=A0ABQ4GU19_9ACTN|nr:GNAT family N-acetyltransferase [Microbispora siamensis]GIH64893.1 hypothetical protein Msi02_57100 [Microbispora siamensis]